MRFLFLLLAFIWICMLVRSIIKAAVHFLLGQTATNNPTLAAKEPKAEVHRLIRDPECGVYIREDRAVPLTSAAGTVHFCSSACRDRHFARQQKLAASA